ncbi:PAAR domain-containing protein, partial [Escherichia coli]|nr:PAAR domain-containing protein [Escherichia coli]
MRGIIRVGDATSHGGQVVTGSAVSEVMGRPVARLGDTCIC